MEGFTLPVMRPTATGLHIAHGSSRAILVTGLPLYVTVEEEGEPDSFDFGFGDLRLFARWLASRCLPYDRLADTAFRDELADGLEQEAAPLWDRMLERIHPTVVRVHRLLASEAGNRYEDMHPSRRLEFYDSLYRQEYLVSDILNYRACRAAVIKAEHLSGYRRHELKLVQPDHAGRNYVSIYRFYVPDNLDHPFTVQNRRAVPDYFGRRSFSDDPGYEKACLAALRDWKSLFSYNRKPYTSLKRTLMAVPTDADLPVEALCALSLFRLRRPLTCREELLLSAAAAIQLCAHYARPHMSRAVLDINLDMLYESRQRDIARALDLFAEHVHEAPCGGAAGFSRYRELAFLALHYSRGHAGRITGLTRRALKGLSRPAIIIHPEGEPQKTERPTAKPPVPLPGTEGITFLDTIERILQEGEMMRHCIGAYSWRAMSGQCFLFHVEHGDEHASVEVDCWGNVVQSKGPRNTSNRAAEWGAAALAEWGRTFPGREGAAGKNGPGIRDVDR